MVNAQDKFSIFVPLDTFQKAKDKNGKELLKIGGIASNSNTGLDADGEIIDVDGMDLSRFLSTGFINFNHLAATDPSAIIGEPTKAEKKDGKLYVEAILYPDSEKARQVYDLAHTLNKSSSTRRLGYSIEGRCIERDATGKRVTKSMITGLAVTPSPKCSGTELTVIKGGLDSIQFENQKDSEHIVDITDNDGTRRVVDKNFNIHIYKAEGVQEAATAKDAEGVTQVESVDNAPDPRKKKKKKNIENIFENSGKSLSKSEIYAKFLGIFNLSPELCKGLYSLIEEVQTILTPNMSKESIEITPEAIQKAMEILNLSKAEKTDKKKESDEDKDDEKKESKKEEKVEKAMPDANKFKSDYAELMKKAAEMQAQAKEYGIDVSEETNGGKTETQSIAKSEAVKPEINVEEIKKSLQTEIMGDVKEQFTALGMIITSKEKENEELRKSISQMSIVTDELGKRLGILESTPVPSKAVSTNAKAVERFDKGGDNGKSYKTYSLNNKSDRAKIADIMFSKALIGNEIKDEYFAKSVEYLEMTGNLWGGSTKEETNHYTQLIAERLKNECNIVVVR